MLDVSCLTNTTALHFIDLSKTVLSKVLSYNSVRSGMCFPKFVPSKSEL